MNAVRQSFRPKHQVLVLKCYPRFQKNAAEVKPNSSELSYLLYYTSTRRSKVQKVGAFLEKKAGSDVSRARIGNVQVTLQILRALIDKSPRDVPLYAPYVLRILSLICRSKDINMVEESIPTFNAFCEHHDVATLAADQGHIRQFEEVVKLYARFAIGPPAQPTEKISTPVTIRWKSAGLQAIKSISSSEVVGADGGRQLSVIMPMILQNLYSDQADYLSVLQQRVEASEKSEKDGAMKRRMSIATVRTVDTSSESNPAAVSGTTADADRLAEEEVGILALKSLKQIYSANNRLQIRIATGDLLKFVSGKVTRERPDSYKSFSSSATSLWATSLMEMVTRWTPVQDRFVIVVTTMESLVRSPISEENLEQQLVLVTLAGWLLRSTINMIGLSVMDVLLGLIQHILLLLQLGGKGSSVLPHYQQTDAINLFKGSGSVVDLHSPASDRDTSNDVSSPSATRQELLVGMQKCIGDLATHIYYSDQISDMVSAILLRLKPSVLSEVSSPIAAIERPAAAAQAISNSVKLQEDPNADEFFSFGTARVTALNAIKEVLTVANIKGPTTSTGAIGRNRVGVQVWEGTQWLLRDEDRRVRRAYVDALLTWLGLEMSRNDLRVMEDKLQPSKSKSKGGENAERTSALTKRAVSSASQRSKTPRLSRSTFLQLLHLAVYEDALESPESETDILLLHLLLTKLVEKLGVNAVKNGLPMLIRLQEDINYDQRIKTPEMKVNIGSLVHGYLWAMSKQFEFDSTMVGYDINQEVTRRKEHGLWLDAVQIPPLPLDRILTVVPVSIREKVPFSVLQTESLKPFDASLALVNQIALTYSTSVASPPSSPPSSPGRVYSLPAISSGAPSSSNDRELPAAFKEAMLSKWTKETCIATVERAMSYTGSVHGSRHGTNGSPRHGLLSVNGHTTRNASPGSDRNVVENGKQSQDNNKQQPVISPLLPLKQDRFRRSSNPDSSPVTPVSSSDHPSTLRVDDLKRVLAGGALAEAFSSRNTRASIRGASPLRNSSTAYNDFASNRNTRSAHNSISVGSDSIVSADGFESASEGDLTHPLPPPQPPLDASELANEYSQQLTRRPYEHSPSPSPARPSSSRGDYAKPRPRTSSSASEDPDANARALKGELVPPLSRGSGGSGDDDEVPPVPPLPPSLSMHNNSIALANKLAMVTTPPRVSNGGYSRPTTAPREKDRDTAPRERERERESSERDSNARSSLKPVMGSDKQALIAQLLSGIEVGNAGQGKGGVGRPPY